MKAKTFICATCRKERDIDKLASRPGSFDPECRHCVSDRKPLGRYVNGIRIWEPQALESLS